ncbi:MAG: HEAT repeat domain-containing protein, partial [Acidobacteriia bacterium]|nr:HEAT repeat domain-containing protein [Terriglobia bacterium]
DADQIRKALKDRNNFLVSKAAAIAGSRGLPALIPDLEGAFDRFMKDPVKSDPKCWAKMAIAKSLKELNYDGADLFLRGLRHIQMEPSFGRPEDSAVTLRATCALALVACPLPRAEILTHLVDALGGDPAKPVRADAARAIAQIPGPDSILLLRLKALAGDAESEVTGQCLASLLEIDAAGQIAFVAKFLKQPGDVAFEAAAALGECHDPGAAAVLIEHFTTGPDFEMQRAILLSLGASRHAQSAQFLTSVIADGRRDPAGIAIQALAAGRFRDEYRGRVRAAVADRGDAKLIDIFEKEFH